MPFLIGAAKSDIPDGKYLASLTKVEELSSLAFSGKYRKWSFLLDVNGQATELSVNTSINNAPGTRTYAFLSALLGRELKAGESVDDPIGQKALAVVGQNKNGYPTILELEAFSQPEVVFPGVPR